VAFCSKVSVEAFAIVLKRKRLLGEDIIVVVNSLMQER
jgi:hypothetical protein